MRWAEPNALTAKCQSPQQSAPSTVSPLDRRVVSIIDPSRMTELPDPAAALTMADVRRDIDALDRALVTLLARRMRFIERAGIIKPTRDTVRDEWRKADVIAKVRAAARAEDFPENVAGALWETLVEASIAHEFTVFDQR